MKKRQNLVKLFLEELSTEISGLRTWLQGVWSSLRRLIKRSLHPRSRQPSHTVNAQVSPLMGLEQFRHPESLTVGNLMAKVQWRIPKPTKTAGSPSIATVREEINWD